MTVPGNGTMADMGQTGKERQAQLKAFRRERGWRELAFWIHADDVQRVKDYIAKLVKSRGGFPENKPEGKD